jgi:predicted CXXCH cytochrome family protein
MTKNFRTQVVLAAVVAVAGALSFAQSNGEAVYKAKCAMCHGPAGTPNPSMAKAMGIKPASDPEIKKMTVDQVVAVIKSGKGKMKPVAGISDADAKSSAAYFHNLK